MAGACPGGSGLLAVPASPAHSATTQDVDLHRQVLEAGPPQAARAGSACARPSASRTRPRQRRCSSPARAALPQGRGRERALLSQVQPRRAPRQGAARLPEGLEARQAAAPSARRRRSSTTRERQDHALQRRRRQGGNPDDHHLRAPDLGPVMTLPGVLKQRPRHARTATCSTRRVPADQDAAERARCRGDVLRRDHPRPDRPPARAHDPLHRRPVLCDGTFFLLDGAVQLPGRHHEGGRARALHAQRRPALPLSSGSVPTRYPATGGSGLGPAPRVPIAPWDPLRVAVISDIHSNLPALEAVLADIGRQRPRPGLVPGDIVGYGASPTPARS